MSFLGYTNYRPCKYGRENYVSEPVRFIQEATLDYLQEKEKWGKDDVAYILLTKGAKEKNWNDDGQRDREGNVIMQPGLKTVLEAKNYPFKIVPVEDLPDGNNEAEILEIFQRAFACICENDELYFDITHGFRYLPMLSIVLGNYAKFLRNVTIKSITYGNFEVVQSKQLEVGPIVDLLPLATLQDWSYASAQFLENGDSARLKTLGYDSVSPILAATRGKNTDATLLRKFVETLDKVTNERRFCRLKDIIKSKSFSKLSKFAQASKTEMVKPLTPVIQKVVDTFPDFDTQENVMNGFAAARWCYDNGMFQQALTILRENIVTLLCMEENLNWEIEHDRDIIEKALQIYIEGIPEDNWNLSSKNYSPEEMKALIIKSMRNEHLKKIRKKYDAISQYRNDYNHAGMKKSCIPYDNFETNIQNYINDTLGYLEQWGYHLPRENRQ